MGFLIIGIIITIAYHIHHRIKFGWWGEICFGFLNILVGLIFALTFSVIASVAVDGTSFQTSHFVEKSRKPLRSFEYNCFLVNTGDYINYLIDSEAGVEFKTAKSEYAVVNQITEGEPFTITLVYNYTNPILRFLFANFNHKYVFYIPEDSTIANYYMQLEGG